jgi:hypothetical protein
MKRQRMVRRLALLVLIMVSTGSLLSAATVEERLDQINRLPEQARNESLEREARKEGELIWYAAMGSDPGPAN